MKISQLSVFLENRVGIINEVTAVLSKNDINMQAFSVAEGAEFGILRVIVPDPEKAKEVLRAADFKVNTTDVVCLNTPNKAGSLSKVMEFLAADGVFIQYMYAFSEGDTASIVIRPNDIDKCGKSLEKCCEQLSAEDSLYKF